MVDVGDIRPCFHIHETGIVIMGACPPPSPSPPRKHNSVVAGVWWLVGGGSWLITWWRMIGFCGWLVGWLLLRWGDWPVGCLAGNFLVELVGLMGIFVCGLNGWLGARSSVLHPYH